MTPKKNEAHVWMVEAQSANKDWDPHPIHPWYEKRDEARKSSNGDPELRTRKYVRKAGTRADRCIWIVEVKDEKGRWIPDEDIRHFDTIDECRKYSRGPNRRHTKYVRE